MGGIDHYSYELGIIECFNEMVKAGLKPIALSHPCDTKEERDSYLADAEEICRRYGNEMYVEDVPLLTDLFPAAMNEGKYNLVFYRDKADLDRYLKLKQRRRELEAEGRYAGAKRRAVAEEFGRLLGYPMEGITRLIEETERTEGR